MLTTFMNTLFIIVILNAHTHLQKPRQTYRATVAQNSNQQDT